MPDPSLVLTVLLHAVTAGAGFLITLLPARTQLIHLSAVDVLIIAVYFAMVLFIGFCVILGFTKTKRTAGGSAPVIKSLDERISHQPMIYFAPTAPRGPADQLRAPELLEAAARK